MNSGVDACGLSLDIAFTTPSFYLRTQNFELKERAIAFTTPSFKLIPIHKNPDTYSLLVGYCPPTVKTVVS
ncbi:hypothetical protein [Nostoc sp. TCL26-01]|uniref:hypothetical protein n=1 Tax=Nostoc sp. TCL26-01 TaxID=2576904 RepID=UPI0015BD8707|nr:hypothetical protein [Nostoc sp. TCL26-01]